MVSTFILSILSYFEFISVKYKLEAIKREHYKCVFLSGIPLQLPQCLPLQEDQVCIHLARKAKRVDGWLGKIMKSTGAIIIT